MMKSIKHCFLILTTMPRVGASHITSKYKQDLLLCNRKKKQLERRRLEGGDEEILAVAVTVTWGLS